MSEAEKFIDSLMPYEIKYYNGYGSEPQREYWEITNGKSSFITFDQEDSLFLFFLLRRCRTEEMMFLVYWREYLPDEPFLAAQKSWKKILEQLEDKNSPWGNGKHMGDCINGPNTCIRCLFDECKKGANFYLQP